MRQFAFTPTPAVSALPRSPVRPLRFYRCYSSSVPTITDPLVKYQSLLSTGALLPDPAQHRLAHHLRSVYARLKDYVPTVEYRTRLKAITELTAHAQSAQEEDLSNTLAVRGHPIWRNPLFKNLVQSPHKDDLALIKLLSNHEQAMEIKSPRGLFVSGEVGTGKSMLLDLLAEGLPTSRKRRWHFNTFILYIFSQLEVFRKSRPHLGETGEIEPPYSLFWMAQKLVEDSPILFLDEFQMPDRAASKILNHLMIAFFQLGGVLIASSNRMPEELQRAAGVDYAPAPFRDMVTKFLSFGMKQQKGELFGSTSDFAAFVEVLKARCDFWNMDGSKDYRRRDIIDNTREVSVRAGHVDERHFSALEEIHEEIVLDEIDPEDVVVFRTLPRHYLLDTEGQPDLAATVFFAHHGGIDWASDTLYVYGRAVNIPKVSHGIAFFNFEDLTRSFGPADYITLASKYHTFIIDKVPILTLSLKNEARRFITFLDALYEAGCKIHIRAAAGPDDLFFPDTREKKAQGNIEISSAIIEEDVTYSETIAEVYQDQAAPFRPNVSYYDASSTNSQYDPDQDAGRHAGPESSVDYTKTHSFTGEDERFAYKRAASRLWELCGKTWHSREGQFWHPLPEEARHWEKSTPSVRLKAHDMTCAGSWTTEIRRGEKIPVDQHAGMSRFAIERTKMLESLA